MTTFAQLATDHWHHGGWWFLAPLFWIGVWILIIILIKGLFFRRRRHWHWHHESDPRSILAGRYARGEIDEAEYRQRLEVLNRPQK